MLEWKAIGLWCEVEAIFKLENTFFFVRSSNFGLSYDKSVVISAERLIFVSYLCIANNFNFRKKRDYRFNSDLRLVRDQSVDSLHINISISALAIIWKIWIVDPKSLQKSNFHLLASTS